MVKCWTTKLTGYLSISYLMVNTTVNIIFEWGLLTLKEL